LIGGAENAGVENAGVEKIGVDSRGGKCRSGKYRSENVRKAVKAESKLYHATITAPAFSSFKSN